MKHLPGEGNFVVNTPNGAASSPSVMGRRNTTFPHFLLWVSKNNSYVH